MSNFVLKIIACTAMFLGHIPFAESALAIPCIFIGRLAFPIFAFLLSEGYVYTKNYNKYLKRLLVLAFISQIPAYLLFFNDFSTLYLNIFFTLALGLLAIRVFDKIKNKFFSYLIIFLLVVVAEVSGCDFGGIGVLMILFFYIAKSHGRFFLVVSQLCLMFLLFADDYAVYPLTLARLYYITIQLIFTIASLIFINLYNGKLGKTNQKNKLLFYFFYPIHLVLLCLIKYF